MSNFLHFLAEDLHSELFDIMDDTGDIYKKHKRITTHIRKLIADGVDTGLEGSRAKRGSSRAVYFPKDKKEVRIDGVPTHMHTALKIAFPGDLDGEQYRKNGMLGELQNNVESSHYYQEHSILIPKGHKEFETNEEHGILAPVIDSSHDDSWLEMGKADNISAKKFRDLTKSDSHPNGLHHNDVSAILDNEHKLKFGRGRTEYTPTEQAIVDHPFTQKLINLIHNTDIHPADLFEYGKVGRNFGVWKHPVTGKEYPVVRDYGFTDSIAKEYSKRRRLKYEQKRGY